jgi:uncharacterized membrane protein YgdD (TMEM256/DUF423 family)
LQKRTDKQVNDRSHSSWQRQARSFFIYAILAIGFVFAVFFARSIFESRRYLALGNAARKSGELNTAILHYRHALEWYAPFGGACDLAVEKLITIGNAQSKKGDIQTALFAYRSARIGILATQHLWTPYSDEVPMLDKHIANLMSAQASTGSSTEATQHALRFQKQLGALQIRQRNAGLAFLSGMAFFFWLGSLTVLVIYGFDQQGKPRPTLKWLAPLSILLLVAVVGLVRIA